MKSVSQQSSHVRSFFSKEEVKKNFSDTAWQKIIFKELESMLLSDSRPFPCFFGVSGFKTNQ